MGSNDAKIMSLQDLAKIVASLKEQGKRIVHCHGVFDLLHIGHIRYFEQAKRSGDVLIVTLTPDRFVDKGPHRPAFPENLRSEAIASLRCVDFVAINEWPTAEDTLRLLRPDVYAKGSEFKELGSDMTGKIDKEAQVVKEIGAKLVFTEDIVFSSTTLINRYISAFPVELQEYLNLFRQRYSLEDILTTLEDFASLRVLVVGDAIVDDYHFCESIGKSSKDPALAVKYKSGELFAGGALAIANHLSDFVGSLDIVTSLGESHTYEEFIRSRLKTGVTPHFLIKPGGHTVVKRRYIDAGTFNKLLEIYVIDDNGLPSDLSKEASLWLEKNLHKYDLVIAADFGNGFITEEIINTLCGYSRYLSVMTQANAGNRGFHTVSRYPRADYVCIAEHEIRLETRDLVGELRPMMTRLGLRLGCSRFVVTRGRKGCLSWGNEDIFLQVPAVTQTVVDRVGAGDAFFSVSSLAACKGLSPELVAFLGNVSGGLAVSSVGNAKPTDKMSLKKQITSLLK